MPEKPSLDKNIFIAQKNYDKYSLKELASLLTELKRAKQEKQQEIKDLENNIDHIESVIKSKSIEKNLDYNYQANTETY